VSDSQENSTPNPSDQKPVPRNKDSMANVLTVALGVCFVCAIIVAGSAVSLKPTIQANKALDRNKNILIAAGLYKAGETQDSDIDGLFEQFTIRVVDLEQKRFLTEDQIAAAGIDVSKYDQRKAAKVAGMSMELTNAQDIASISRRARYSVAYLLEKGGKIDRIVLPVHGYGLWSTLYGFLALQGDGNTVAGITFYEQKETAGLGGEVDNPRWKNLWVGKEIYDDGEVALTVIKGSVDPSLPQAVHQIDGLAGATLTSKGVENLIAYWLGEEGFGPLLANLQG
jgi:Na+-transporting NADH:ubiquinone oxidoreductase subunit C